MKIEVRTETQYPLFADIEDLADFKDLKGLKEKKFSFDSPVLNGSFKEKKCDDFDIFEINLNSYANCSVQSFGSSDSYVSLSAVRKGNIYTKFISKNTRHDWQKGTANLVSAYEDMLGRNCMRRDDCIEMINLMLSPGFFRDLSDRYPEMFGIIFRRYEKGESFFFSPENITFSPLMNAVFEDIKFCHLQGNISRMYLEAKILECFSIFFKESVTINNKESLSGNSIKSKMYEVKAILEKEYLNPPVLGQIALMVGTNECTLKKAFKEVFNTTVFGYLLDFRMNLAMHYLKDTHKSIQDIALLVGYEHSSHFASAFKNKYSVTPSMCRAFVN